tara:strand:- start:589 stop:1059 length:471 start_codon:yes stop_codon:yes gene_type:complete
MGFLINRVRRYPILDLFNFFRFKEAGGLNKGSSTVFTLDLNDVDGWVGDKKVYISMAPYKPFLTLSLIDSEFTIKPDGKIIIYFKLWDNNLGRYIICSIIYSLNTRKSAMSGQRHYTTSRNELDHQWVDTLSETGLKTHNCMERISSPTRLQYLFD